MEILYKNTKSEGNIKQHIHFDIIVMSCIYSYNIEKHLIIF